MVEKIGGGADKHPPDKAVEKIPEPKIGYIYRLNRKYTKGYDFIKVEAITPADQDPQGKARIELTRLNPKKKLGRKWERFSPGLTLEKFLLKNNPNNYVFAADSEEALYDQENIPADLRPARILDIRAVGEPGLASASENPTPNSAIADWLNGNAGEDPDELLLDTIAPAAEESEIEGDLEEPEVEGPSPEPESAPDDDLQEPSHQEQNSPEEKLRDRAPELFTLFLELQDPGLSASEFFDKISEFRNQAIGYSFRPAEGSYTRLDHAVSPQRGFQIRLFDNGRIDISVWDQDQVNFGGSQEEVDSEITPEKQRRLELGSRLGLTPEQLADREALEKAVDKVRAEYASNIYDHEQKLGRVLSILRLKKNPEPDERYKNDYEQKLKELQEFDMAALKRHLEDASTSAEDRDASAGSYLERYNRLEAVALWSEQQKIRAVHQEAGVEQLGGFGKKVVEKVNTLAENYKKLSWKQKLAIGGGLAVGHMGLALVSGPAAIGLASLWLGTKVITGTAAYKGTSKFVEQGAQWAGDKIANRKDTKEVKKIAKQFNEGEGTVSEYLEKLNAVALKNIAEVDKKLAAYERRSFFAKAAALTLIFGVPASRFLGDIFGGGAEAAASASDTATGTETIEAVDHLGGAPAGVRVVPPAEGGTPAPEVSAPPASPEPVEVPTARVEVQPVEVRSGPIGFKNSPLSPEEKYWLDVRNGQGNYIDSGQIDPVENIDDEIYQDDSFESPDIDSDGGGNLDDMGGTQPQAEALGDPAPEPQADATTSSDIHDAQTDADAAPAESPIASEQPTGQSTEAITYNYEESRYQSLTEAQRPAWRENMTLLQGELLDINHTEFGPDYTPTNWQADQLWALNKGNSVQDIIAFDSPQYNYDPRDYYQEGIGRRGIYLPSVNPEPQLGDGPDARAIYTMDQIKDEYRHNIAEMHRAAVAKFGSVAHPLGRRETLQAYMSRIATLYTRARLENPDFRLKF